MANEFDDGSCYACKRRISDWTGDACEFDYCMACLAKDTQKALERARDEWKEYLEIKRELDARNLAFRTIDNEIAKIGTTNDCY